VAEPFDALTLWQPWASLVADRVKPVENRNWAPPKRLANRDLAIHAAVRWTRAEQRTSEELWTRYRIQTPAQPVLSAVVGVVRVLGYVTGYVHPNGIAVSAIRCFDADRRAEFDRILESEPFRIFFHGPHGWVLGDVRRLAEPVSCRGAQGLWKLPAELSAMVERQVGRG
jgi:hypothetical protein